MGRRVRLQRTMERPIVEQSMHGIETPSWFHWWNVTEVRGNVEVSTISRRCLDGSLHTKNFAVLIDCRYHRGRRW